MTNSTINAMDYPGKKDLPRGVWTEDFEKYPEDTYTFYFYDYKCEAKRNSFFWHWCGYVILPESHPDYGKSYEEIKGINVHGGFTYSHNGKFGFDCAHFGDILPMDSIMNEFGTFGIWKNEQKYWGLDDVKKEIENLAKQFKNRE